MSEYGRVLGEAPAGSQHEQRAVPRFTLLLRTAKLVCARGEFLCVIRDASPQGLKVKIFAPLPKGQMEIELANGDRYPVARVWEEGNAAGLQFLAPVNVGRLLEEAPEGLKKRSMRLRFSMPATITLVGVDIPPVMGEFRDISQQGACLTCNERLPVNGRLKIVSPALPRLDARVCWRRVPQFGVTFEQAFRFDELASLIAGNLPTFEELPSAQAVGAPRSGGFGRGLTNR